VKHLDLFSGIGGFALAARRVGWETIAFCEIEPYCQKVLRKHWPDVPIYDDVRELTGETVGHVDIITGGYPCTPFSSAGKRRGRADDRYLWPEFARLIRELRPRWVVGENVAGHIGMGLDSVLADLEREGYAWEAFVIPACAVDAPHRRDRVWIFGSNTEYDGSAEQERKHQRPENGNGSGANELVAGTVVVGDSRNNAQGFWKTEPSVGRVANGIPQRVDRLRGLGNAIVPQIAQIIYRSINETL